MKDHLVPELGQQFACAGVRFTIAGTIDCFALMVVQWGDNKIEISLLGLARFRQPRDTTARAICYVELQILMTIKPSEGTFKLQALLPLLILAGWGAVQATRHASLPFSWSSSRA